MQKINGLSRKTVENIARYALIFVMVIVTPFLAAPVAKLFDWAVLAWSKEGQLRQFYVELFTGLFWILELVGFFLLQKYVVKKHFPVTRETAQKEESEVEMQAQTELATTQAVEGEKKNRKFTLKLTPLLPMQNVGILLLITVACILIVTLQIGWNVKPFYELGNKTTQSAIIIKIGEVFRNLIKCVLILLLLKISLSLMEELTELFKLKEKKAELIKWLGVGILLVLFGVCDALVFNNPFAWTYLLFYVAFAAIYYFTKQAPVKSYLLIFFIYIF